MPVHPHGARGGHRARRHQGRGRHGGAAARVPGRVGAQVLQDRAEQRDDRAQEGRAGRERVDQGARARGRQLQGGEEDVEPGVAVVSCCYESGIISARVFGRGCLVRVVHKTRSA